MQYVVEQINADGTLGVRAWFRTADAEDRAESYFAALQDEGIDAIKAAIDTSLGELQ